MGKNASQDPEEHKDSLSHELDWKASLSTGRKLLHLFGSGQWRINVAPNFDSVHVPSLCAKHVMCRLYSEVSEGVFPGGARRCGLG